MDIASATKVGTWGVPFCFTVSGASGTPGLSIRRGAQSPQVMPQPDGSYLVCVTPITGSGSFGIFITDGPIIRTLSIATRGP